MALIFLTVPPIYLLESFVPLLIGGPLIVIAAIYGSIRALAPGGEMDSAYEKVGLAMAPLGFEVSERPKVNIEVREATTGRVGPKIHGDLVLSGERHRRAVSVRLGSGEVSARSGTAKPQSIGKLKLVTPEGAMDRGTDGLFRAKDGNDLSADPKARVQDGALEGSNVSPVETMVSMIAAARQFEHQMKLLSTAEKQDQQAAKLLSENG